MPSGPDEIPPNVNISRPDPPPRALRPPIAPRDRIQPPSASVDLAALGRLDPAAIISLDAEPFRHLIVAGHALADAEAAVAEAVAAARAAGASWTVIAAALDLPVDVARSRFSV